MSSCVALLLSASSGANYNRNELFIIPGARVPMKIYENWTAIA